MEKFLIWFVHEHSILFGVMLIIFLCMADGIIHNIFVILQNIIQAWIIKKSN